MGAYKSSVFNFYEAKDCNGQVMIASLSTLVVSWFYPQYARKLLTPGTIFQKDDEYAQEMLQAGFIVPEEKDEYGEMQKQLERFMNNQKDLYYVVAPSLQCQFRCRYCFQSGYGGGRMINDEECDRIANFMVRDMQSRPSLRNMYVSWFGGEPMLAFQQIKRITIPVKAFADANGIHYHSSIITNGLLYTRNRAEWLHKEGGLALTQITLDGMPDYYAFVKGTAEENFYTVTDNICDTYDLSHMSIRLNVTKENISQIEPLVRYLDDTRQLNQKVHIYLAPVQPIQKSCMGGNGIYQQTDFIKACCEIQRRLAVDGMKVRIQGSLPQPKSAYCGAYRKSFQCIGPDMNRYPCEHFIGRPEYAIGSIENGPDPDSSILKSFYQTRLTRCRTCRFVALCQGGCESNRTLEHNDVDCTRMDQIVRRQIANMLAANHITTLHGVTL